MSWFHDNNNTKQNPEALCRFNRIFILVHLKIILIPNYQNKLILFIFEHKTADFAGTAANFCLF